MSPSRCCAWAVNPGCPGEDSTARSPKRRASPTWASHVEPSPALVAERGVSRVVVLAPRAAHHPASSQPAGAAARLPGRVSPKWTAGLRSRSRKPSARLRAARHLQEQVRWPGRSRRPQAGPARCGESTSAPPQAHVRLLEHLGRGERADSADRAPGHVNRNQRCSRSAGTTGTNRSGKWTRRTGALGASRRAAAAPPCAPSGKLVALLPDADLVERFAGRHVQEVRVRAAAEPDVGG